MDQKVTTFYCSMVPGFHHPFRVHIIFALYDGLPPIASISSALQASRIKMERRQAFPGYYRLYKDSVKFQSENESESEDFFLKSLYFLPMNG